MARKRSLVNSRTPLSLSDGLSLWKDGDVTEGHEKGMSGFSGTSARTEHAKMERKKKKKSNDSISHRWNSVSVKFHQWQLYNDRKCTNIHVHVTLDMEFAKRIRLTHHNYLILIQFILIHYFYIYIYIHEHFFLFMEKLVAQLSRTSRSHLRLL